LKRSQSTVSTFPNLLGLHSQQIIPFTTRCTGRCRKEAGISDSEDYCPEQLGQIDGGLWAAQILQKMVRKLSKSEVLDMRNHETSQEIMRNLWFTQFFGQNHDTILPQRYSTYETTYYESYEAEEGDCDEDAGREAKRQKNLCGGRG